MSKEYPDFFNQSSLINVTEAYNGKTSILEEAENVLDDIIEEIRENPTGNFKSHPLNLKLQSLLEKQFGFKKVFISWRRDSRLYPHIYTFASLDTTLHLYEPEKSREKGYYDTRHSKTCFVSASMAFAFSSDVTGGEYLAAILHEIGHNFDDTPFRTFSTFLDILGTYIQSRNASTYASYGNYTAAGQSSMNTMQGVIGLFNQTNTGKYVNGAMLKFGDDILNHFGIFKTIAFHLRRLASKLVIFMDHLTAAPQLLLLTLTTPIVFLPSHLTSILTQKGEEFADSFATQYGYGPELTSALTKLEKMGTFKGNPEGILGGIAKFQRDLVLAKSYLINAMLVPTHGPVDARTMSMIDGLENDINDPQYPAEVKENMRKDIEKLRDMCNNYINATDVEKANIAKFYRSTLNHLFKGRVNFLSKLFPACKTEFNESKLDEDISDLYYLNYRIMERYNNNEISESEYEIISEKMKDKISNLILEQNTTEEELLNLKEGYEEKMENLERIELIYTDICEKEDNDLITETEANKFKDMLSEKLDELVLTEGSKIQAMKDKLQKTGEKLGDPLVKGMNKRADKVAHAVAKRTSKKKTLTTEEYNSVVKKAKLAYKVGEVLVAHTVLLLPFQLVYDAALQSGISKSSDETDKKIFEIEQKAVDTVKNTAKALLSKVKALIAKVKGKEVTKENFVNPMKALEIQGKNIAKQVDSINSGKISKLATESNFDIFDSYLLNTQGHFVENALDILDDLVENGDYDNQNVFGLVNHYLEKYIG